MALEAAKATPQGVEHRNCQNRVVTTLDQFLSDLPLVGDVSLAFGNVPIDLCQVFAFPILAHDGTAPYGFGETRVAPLALVTFITLSG
jgi:hypothetical protein